MSVGFAFCKLEYIIPILAKWNDKINAECVLCGQIETLKHMLYECHYISYIWNIVSHALKIHVQWKNIVTGFYNCENDNVNVNNCIISIVAYCIFKENIHSKYECKIMKQKGLIEKVKMNLKFYATVIGIQNYRVVLNTLQLL